MSKWNYLTVDTETANSMEDPLVYDIGWAIHDNEGNIIVTHSFINYDVFVCEKDMMKSAYFANKIEQYEADLKAGKRKLARFKTIKKIFRADCKLYAVKAIIAHNARFDNLALNTTERWLTSSKFRYFFPYGIPIYDTMKMAEDVILTMKSYQTFCEENEYLCANGKPRKTAEILYRFINNENDFEESHTGLEDVLIEMQIFVYCTKRHKKMRRKLWEN